MTRDEIWSKLKTVSDPEVPGLSIVDLGIVRSVTLTRDKVHVVLRPTFVGCPALDWFRTSIIEALAPLDASVEYELGTPWSSDDISPEGHDAIRAFGIAPPGESSQCPLCGSDTTRLISPFGPQLCQARYYCDSCRQPFDAWKTV